MPRPKVFQYSAADEKPMPLLTVDVDKMAIMAVDSRGNRLAYIASWHSFEGEFSADGRAENCIKDAGYRTDWAEWTEDGAFNGYVKED